MQSQENTKEHIAKHTAKLPDEPGVYYFKGASGAVLYIGKATSLRDRVRSYFSPNLLGMRGEKLVRMMEEFSDIDFQKTDSVLEAMILEANLIKKYQPIYNTRDKDNKSFNHVVITDEEFPRIMLVRGRDLESYQSQGLTSRLNLEKIRDIFGPFPQGSAIREGLVLIRKIFPFRDNKCIPCIDQIKNFKSDLKSKQKPTASLIYDISYISDAREKICKACFNRHIGLCPGVCTGEITAKEYAKTVRNIADFFQGNKKKIIKNLETEMKAYAKAQEFEKAGEAKRKIFALTHIRDISLIKQENLVEKPGLVYRVEAYDVAHFAGKDVVGVMTVVENGAVQKNEYRKFKIKDNPGINDTKALREILKRRLGHPEWHLPSLIVVDGGIAQKNAAEGVLERLQVKIPVMAVTKDEHHKPKAILGERHLLSHEQEILLANAEAHRYGIAYHRRVRQF